MDYEEIGDLISDIKFQYVETGEWAGTLCARLLELTHHVPLMVGRRRGIAADDLPDIIQQAYQAAFTYLNTLDDDRTFPRYLYTITDNLCRKYWRRRIRAGHQDPLVTEDGRSTTTRPSAEQFDGLSLREDLRDAVGQLPQMYRETIELFYFAGLKAREIADRLNISTNTVTSRVRRGRMLLKELLEA
ncbi:sigma-70 family RNA polymerase sigma factor [bacterium]|nr:sigma-70 family RNA polymerase sigma factor [candidate division CSSED10-310 bacterium]